MSYEERVNGAIFDADAAVKSPCANVSLGRVVSALHAVEMAREADAEIYNLRTKLATETKRAEAAEAQRDKLAELLHNLKLDREDHDGDCATGTWSVAAEEVLDAALAEMERNK